MTPTEARVSASGLADHCAVPGTLEYKGGQARLNPFQRSDLFTFVLKRERKAHLVADHDNHSRFSTSSGLSRNT